jgi:trk system potassium uptake protein TrkH
VDDVLKTQTVFFVALAGVTVSLGTAVVSVLEPSMDMVSSFSSVVATLFNIGPGLGAVGPVKNFSMLGPWTQMFLSLLMLLGRLEFFAVLVLFRPSFWRKF